MIGLQAGLLLVLSGTCFGNNVFHSEHPTGVYQMTYGEAFNHCHSLGAHLATREELEQMRRKGYSNCRCGWTLDKTVHYPMTYALPGCGNAVGLHYCNWAYEYDAYCFKGDSVGNCSKPLGIQNGAIHGSQLYASSEYNSWFPLFQNSKWSASIARLHNKDLVNAWVPEINGRHQWLEVDLNAAHAVTGILTQGASRLGKKMWVTYFEISYSKDKHNYKKINKIFTGNVNNDGIKRNMFPETVIARYIRFHPYSYHTNIALRLELLGCDYQSYSNAINSRHRQANDRFTELPPEDAQ